MGGRYTGPGRKRVESGHRADEGHQGRPWIRSRAVLAGRSRAASHGDVDHPKSPRSSTPTTDGGKPLFDDVELGEEKPITRLMRRATS